jgi:hypothetical protein
MSAMGLMFDDKEDAEGCIKLIKFLEEQVKRNNNGQRNNI